MNIHDNNFCISTLLKCHMVPCRNKLFLAAGIEADKSLNLSQQALALSNLGRARELLERHRPLADEHDFRGREWRYVWEQCQSDTLNSVRLTGNAIGSLASSYDGRWRK